MYRASGFDERSEGDECTKVAQRLARPVSAPAPAPSPRATPYFIGRLNGIGKIFRDLHQPPDVDISLRSAAPRARGPNPLTARSPPPWHCPKTGTYSNKNRETIAEKRAITMRD